MEPHYKIWPTIEAHMVFQGKYFSVKVSKYYEKELNDADVEEQSEKRLKKLKNWIEK